MFKSLPFLFLLVLPTLGKSQHYIGLDAGYLASYITGHPLGSEILVHSGFTGGINYNYQSEKRLNLTSGLRVERYGFDYNLVLIDEFGIQLAEGRVQNRIFGVNIPIRAGYRFGDKWQITPTAGLSLQYALSANTIIPKSITGLGSLSKSQTFLENINQFNLAAAISVEVSTKINGAQVFANLEYRHTLLKLYSDQNSSGNNQSYLIAGLSIGCRIPLFQQEKDIIPYVNPEDLD